MKKLTFDFLHFQVRVPPHEKTTQMAVMMTAFPLIVTLVYLVNKNPTFFEASYGFLVFLMLSYDFRLNLNAQQKTKVGLRIFITGLFM